jgi:hypothetical protein
MAKYRRTDHFEFDQDEITILLKLLGRESNASISELELDLDAFERLWDALTAAAFRPMMESHP